MKKTLKLLILGSLPFVFIFLTVFFINIIKLDWGYAHKSMYTYQLPFDWFKYKLKSNFIKSIINFNENNKFGLPTKRIYVDQKLQNELLIDTPHSTKVWQRGLHYNKKNELKEIRVRFRGDNPRNWLLEKKHWRIKVRKNDVIEKRRYFDYLPFEFRKFLSGKIANELSLLSPNFNMVELYVNDKSEGIYIESETLNESFLRRNNIMPVNLYKAEQILQESIVALESNAFNSPGALSKQAIFNQLPDNDFSDLSFFFKLMRLSYDNKQNYEKLVKKIGIDDWTTFVAYQIITQNFHNDNSHNFRLVADPWSGHLIPIVYDPIIGELNNEDYNFDFSSNDMILLLNKGSLFQQKKLEKISKILNSGILENLITNLNNKNDQIKISENRDVEILLNNFDIFKLLLGLFNKEHINNSSSLEREKLLKFYREYLNGLNNYIKSKAKGNWKKNENGFEIAVDGKLPISNLQISFNGEIPNWISIDLNENGIIDNIEKDLIIYKKNNEFFVPFNFFANRMDYIDSASYLSQQNLKIIKTRFKFLTEKSIKPNKIIFENIFSKLKYDLEESHFTAAPTSILNYPINNIEKNEKVTILSGENIINETKIFKKKVIIEPGTTFNLKKNKSIIFENEVRALGTKDSPIIFKRKGKDSWGTIAFQGEKTDGSILENIYFDGGSGFTNQNKKENLNKIYLNNNIRYISALSFHKAENIKLKNIILKNNSKFDDAVHIVYSKNITLENFKVEDANRDAIDIDISQDIKLINLNILNSNNDAVDLMQSSVLIENSKLIGSKDKALSVGENSFLIIRNSDIKNNNIGIATKDNSFSYVYKSKFTNNKYHIYNYKKNWRYGDGGLSLITDSNFSIDNNIKKDNDIFYLKNRLINLDKYSSIQILNSKFSDKLVEKSIFSKTKGDDHKQKLEEFNAEKIHKIIDMKYQAKLN